MQAHNPDAESHDVLRIGPYQVEDVLGSGPHGTVYAARHVDNARRCVLKRLHRPLAATEPGEEFLRVARVTVELAHPVICDVQQMLVHGGHLVIVADLSAGRTLAQLVAERGPLGPAEVVTLARQLGSGLLYAHQRCVYHTSLHPGNVFLQPDGSVQLTDMAIAALYRLWAGKRPSYPPEREAFMAPEFLAKGIIHPAADIYSFGMLLLWALTGGSGATVADEQTVGGRFAYLEVGASTRPARPRGSQVVAQVPEGTPDVLRHLIASATAQQPSQRPGSMTAVIALLRGAKAATIGARSPSPANDLLAEASPAPGQRSRVCPACGKPVSPAGRVCVACGLVLREPDEQDEPVNYFHGHARKLLARHDLAAAESAYRRALQRDPQQAVLYNELGDVLAVANRFDEAVRAYRQALQLRPDDDDAWHDLGVSLAALHRRQQAREALQRALELTDRGEVRLSARIHLGALAAEEGRFEEAIALWRQVLAEDPHLTAVRLALASNYAALKRYDEAEAELRAVLDAEPGNRHADRMLARVSERAQLERQDTDTSYGVIDDFGGSNPYLGIGFQWVRWW